MLHLYLPEGRRRPVARWGDSHGEAFQWMKP
jgi:hypothetical protein